MNRATMALIEGWLTVCVETLVYYCASDTMRKIWFEGGGHPNFRKQMTDMRALWDEAQDMQR